MAQKTGGVHPIIPSDRHWRLSVVIDGTIEAAHNREHLLSHRDITLIQATVDNGRIYFPSTDLKFFPADCYGDRVGDGHKGTPVVFRAAGLEIETDIRISSAHRLSPRSSFAAFLKQVCAVEGAVVRVTRTSEREYQLDYLAK